MLISQVTGLLEGFRTARDECIPIPDSKCVDLEQYLAKYKRDFDAF